MTSTVSKKHIAVFIVFLLIVGLGFLQYRNVDKKVVSVCADKIKDFSCYQEYFTNAVKKEGIADAFADLKEEYKTNTYVASQCHQLTHVIGHTATELYPDITEAYSHGDPFCWSGYYHGVMEEVVERVGLEQISAKLDTVCSQIPGKDTYSFDYYNCVHGLGHGLMAVTEDEVPESLKLCDNLVGRWEQSSCYSGVFMENVMIDYKGEETKYLRPEEPMYPCTGVDTKYKHACYMMQTSYVLKVKKYDFTAVFDACRGAETNFKDTCFQSLGRDASGNSLQDAQKTKATCDLGKDTNERLQCIIGAAKDFVSYYHSDKEAKNLCSIVSNDLKGTCASTVASYYNNF